MKQVRIAVDVDGCLADFAQAVLNRAKQLGMEKDFPKSCSEIACWDIAPRFSELMKDVWEDEKFWLNIPPLVKELPFTPNCYITQRHVPSEVTAKWLAKHKFPKADVITVSCPTEKLQHVKDRNIDLYVDDLYKTVKQMRDAGIQAILMYQPYQRGHAEECKDLPTIKKWDEVFKYI